MTLPQTLLVVDDAGETAEVLQAVYQPRGLVVERMSSRNSPGEEAIPSTVLVVNSDRLRPSTEPDRFRKVLIGRFDVATEPTTNCERTCRLPSLFEFRELVSAIDRLLMTSV